MTFEIIVFILAILFGIIIYWRESKNNIVYRFFNKISHTKDLQMKSENRKGFIHQRTLLIRLVWIALLFVIVSAIVSFVLPFNITTVQYFLSALVGTLIGTYITSAILFTKSKAKKENLEKVFQKGKYFIEDIVEGEEKEVLKNEEEIKKKKVEEQTKKSARERLRDKGMIK
jgi:NADH:ubiquinone oxidoreductase subunit 3 (subunit A)